jgi:hypothetical protein
MTCQSNAVSGRCLGVQFKVEQDCAQELQHVAMETLMDFAARALARKGTITQPALLLLPGPVKQSSHLLEESSALSGGPWL